MYKRYETLLRLVVNYGLGFALTNQWSNSKPHFLQMRKEGLVEYTDGHDMRIVILNGYHPYGSERNSNWYTITLKGLELLRELFPDNEEVKTAMRKLIDGAFHTNDTIRKEIKERASR